MVNPHECAPLTPLFRLVFAPFRSQILAFRGQNLLWIETFADWTMTWARNGPRLRETTLWGEIRDQKKNSWWDMKYSFNHVVRLGQRSEKNLDEIWTITRVVRWDQRPMRLLKRFELLIRSQNEPAHTEKVNRQRWVSWQSESFYRCLDGPSTSLRDSTLPSRSRSRSIVQYDHEALSIERESVVGDMLRWAVGNRTSSQIYAFLERTWCCCWELSNG